ncbi:TPA: hypothetical protein ACH3X2_002534 [Trebouxia sp. C0005]
MARQAHMMLAEIHNKSLPSPTPKGKRPPLRQLEGPQQDNQVAKVDVKTIHKGGAFKSAKAHACSRLAHGSTVTGDHRTSALHQACFMMLGGVVRSICIGIAIA